MAEKTLASLRIYDADKMSDGRRREIAKWLRRQAKFLVQEGAKDMIAPSFRASYMLPEEVTREEGLTLRSSPEQTRAGAAQS